MRKDFVANASHELRSPLTVISGYLDALADDVALDKMWREPLDEMRRQSERMRTLVEELLQLSRLESVHEPREEQRVDGILPASHGHAHVRRGVMRAMKSP